MSLKFLGSIDTLLAYFAGNITVTELTKKYAAAGIGTGLAAGDTVFFAGFVGAASNGLKTVATVEANEITVSEAVGAGETAAATFKQQAVTDWMPCEDLQFLTGVINCSNGANIYIEQSWNGSDAHTNTTHAITGGTAKEWKVDVVLPKARLRVLNDTTTQTAMAAMLYGR